MWSYPRAVAPPAAPEGWSGGDRLAIHGSPTPTWGHAVSNGCLHAEETELRYLMEMGRVATLLRTPSRARPMFLKVWNDAGRLGHTFLAIDAAQQ